MAAKQRQLNPRQQQAILNFISGMNHYEAGVDAGYSESSAKSQVCRLLSKDTAKAYMKQLQKPKENKAIATQDRLFEILTSIAEGELDDQTVTDQRLACTDLMRAKYGMHVQKVEIEHKTGGVMLVPSISSTDWEADAAKTQKELMDNTIDV